MDNLRSLFCPCGYEFGTADIKPPFTKPPVNFYGGRVKRFSEALCGCGKRYKLYIRPVRQSWEVLDIEPEGGEDLNEVGFNELRKMAKDRGITLPKNANREQILELLG